jgi:hypothetical protein
VITANGENQFAQFRSTLYYLHFNNRNDTLMDLLDALCSHYHARSVVELSLNPLFKRDYNSLYKAITGYQPEKALLSPAELAQPYLPPLWKGKVYLMAVDTTPCPRPYAFKLTERECVYKPSPIKGQIPITYGHEYSFVNLLTERSSLHSPAWTIPLSVKRVSRESREPLTIAQVRALLENPNLSLCQKLCLQLGDTKYSTPAYLAAFADLPNLITLVRSRSNRKYYFPAQTKAQAGRGHPAWYGKAMKLADPTTWPQPDEEITLPKTNHKGQRHWVQIQAWQKVLMRGKCKRFQLPMQRYPFTLVRIGLYNDRKELVFADPLWLIVMGRERQKLSLEEIYAAFCERSSMEHFFRFSKRNLLLDKFQTCETEHEESWWQLVTLAYLQLWVAREYATCLPRPWEQHLPQVKEQHLSPTMVQRSFGEIIRQFGPPSQRPQPRNNSPRRHPGKVPV